MFFWLAIHVVQFNPSLKPYQPCILVADLRLCKNFTVPNETKQNQAHLQVALGFPRQGLEIYAQPRPVAVTKARKGEDPKVFWGAIKVSPVRPVIPRTHENKTHWDLWCLNVFVWPVIPMLQTVKHSSCTSAPGWNFEAIPALRKSCETASPSFN